LKGNKSRESVKEGESKGKGLRRMIQVSKKGKERVIDVEGDNIVVVVDKSLRDLIRKEYLKIYKDDEEGGSTTNYE
jgi:hypothetical protein